jgi:biotin operon repressor
MGNDPAPVGLVVDTPRAGVMLKPLRLKILAEAQEPQSASAIAAHLGLPRQKVNYHVRQLARAGFLRRAGRQRKRGLVEQKYVVTARAFLLGSGVLGPMGADKYDATDKMSAAYLLTLAARVQREAGHAWRDAHAEGKRLPVLSLDTEMAFASAEQRARFAEALTSAVTKVVAEHTAPPTRTTRPFRLVLGCYPIPKKERP